MTKPPAAHLVARPAVGRVFPGVHRVRVGDSDARARMRLDAMARVLQDLAGDDVADALPGAPERWVVRRSVFEVARRPLIDERLELATWASGAGRRWAERRVSFVGDRGGRVEGASLWVAVDDAGRPRPLSSGFAAVYGSATGGRTVSSRLAHEPRPPDAVTSARPFPVRATDVDLLGHVNNANGWALVEEALADHPRRSPLRAEVEHRAPIERSTDLELVVAADDPAGPVRLWGTDRTTGVALLTAVVTALPG